MLTIHYSNTFPVPDVINLCQHIWMAINVYVIKAMHMIRNEHDCIMTEAMLDEEILGTYYGNHY